MNYSKEKKIELNILKKRKIKILLKEPKNNECFECSSSFPKYISLNNGIFICKDCAKNHLNFPKEISDIIKNDLNNLTLKNIQYLCCGGNRKLTEYINREYPNLKKLSPTYFYQTYAMDYYRKYLIYLIEGGLKPIKPNLDKAYELIRKDYSYSNIMNLKLKVNERNNVTNNNSVNINNISENISQINNDSYIKINRNIGLYPKIKPIVGRKNDFRINRSFNKHNNNRLSIQDLNLTTSNFDKKHFLNNTFYKERLNCSSTDLKNTYYSHFKNNYDSDGNYDDFNDINDINENEINEEINNMSNVKEINDLDELNINFNKPKDNLKQKNKINKRNREETNIKVFKINYNSTNSINNIYKKPKYSNYLNTFQENDEDNQKYFNNENKINEKGIKHITSIEDLRNYLNVYNNQKKDNYIFNLDQNPKKSILIEEIKLNINNKPKKEKKQIPNLNSINNNIIINRNLNLFYNNTEYNKTDYNYTNDYNLQKIFKKKTIGNSFSIKEKKKKNNKLNYSLEKGNNHNIFLASTDDKNIFKTKRKIKINNEWERKLGNNIIEKSSEKTFIKVNKKNIQLKPNKKLNNLKNTSSYKNNINNNSKKELNNKNPYIINNVNKNNKKYININAKINLKSKIIQRISRVIKVQKENEEEEKLKTFEKIKVNQNENNLREITKNLNNLNYIGVTTILKKEKDKKEKDKKSKNENINKSFTESKIQITKSYNNLFDTQNRKLVLMKELVNLSSGKRRTILDIIKNNNMSNKSVSPTAKTILKIYNDSKNKESKNININTSINLKVKDKNGYKNNC